MAAMAIRHRPAPVGELRLPAMVRRRPDAQMAEEEKARQKIPRRRTLSRSAPAIPQGCGAGRCRDATASRNFLACLSSSAILGVGRRRTIAESLQLADGRQVDA